MASWSQDEKDRLVRLTQAYTNGSRPTQSHWDSWALQFSGRSSKALERRYEDYIISNRRVSKGTSSSSTGKATVPAIEARRPEPAESSGEESSDLTEDSGSEESDSDEAASSGQLVMLSRWSAEETALLPRLMKGVKEPDWRSIASKFKGRTDEAVKKRWYRVCKDKEGQGSAAPKPTPRASPAKSRSGATDLYKTKWTAEDEAKLDRLMKGGGSPDWEQLARSFKGRSAGSVERKWWRMGKEKSSHPKEAPETSDSEDSDSEDDEEGGQLAGAGSSNLGGAKWTASEENALRRAHGLEGSDWVKVATHLKGRTEMSVKKKWLRMVKAGTTKRPRSAASSESEVEEEDSSDESDVRVEKSVLRASIHKPANGDHRKPKVKRRKRRNDSDDGKPSTSSGWMQPKKVGSTSAAAPLFPAPAAARQAYRNGSKRPSEASDIGHADRAPKIPGTSHPSQDSGPAPARLSSQPVARAPAAIIAAPVPRGQEIIDDPGQFLLKQFDRFRAAFTKKCELEITEAFAAISADLTPINGVLDADLLKRMETAPVRWQETRERLCQQFEADKAVLGESMRASLAGWS